MQARAGQLPPKADYGNDTSIFEFTMPYAHVATTHPSSHVPVLSPHAFQDEVFLMRHHLFIPISEHFL